MHFSRCSDVPTSHRGCLRMYIFSGFYTLFAIYHEKKLIRSTRIGVLLAQNNKLLRVRTFIILFAVVHITHTWLIAATKGLATPETRNKQYFHAEALFLYYIQLTHTHHLFICTFYIYKIIWVILLYTWIPYFQYLFC